MNNYNGNADLGRQKVEAAGEDMRALDHIASSLGTRSGLQDYRILGCVSITPETANAILCLNALGAKEIRWCSDGPDCSDPDVVEYLKSEGFDIFCEPEMDTRRFKEFLDEAACFSKLENDLIVIDDGCIMTRHLVESRSETLDQVQLISEQTASGVTKLKGLYRDGKLECPSFDIDGCPVKHDYDSYIGVREAFLTSFNIVSNRGYAANSFSVYGYGSVGRGVAKGLQSLGAEVFVLDVNPRQLLRARIDGIRVVDMDKSLERADVHVTATGSIDILTKEHFPQAKNRAILANVGHYGEYDYKWLKQQETQKINDYMEEHRLDVHDGKTILLNSTCKGGLITNVSGGNAPFVMGLTFGTHIFSLIDFVQNRKDYTRSGIYDVPQSVQDNVICSAWPEITNKVLSLSDEQRRYNEMIADHEID